MNIKAGLVCLLSGLLLAAPSFAQKPPAATAQQNPAAGAPPEFPKPKKLTPAEKAQLEKLDRENADLNAMAIANMIKSSNGAMTFDMFKGNMSKTDMNPEVRELLLSKVKKIVDGNSARPFTPEEQKRYEAASQQAQKIIFGKVLPLPSAKPSAVPPPAKDLPAAKAPDMPAPKKLTPAEKAQLDKLDRENIDLNAMAIANMIKSSNGGMTFDAFKTNMSKTDMNTETRDLLLSKIKKIIDANSARPFTPEEQKRYEAASQQAQKIIFGKVLPPPAAPAKK